MSNNAPASTPAPVFAEPSPLGLLGLSIGCAALLPIAFHWSLTPAALRMAAMLCLLFGGGCQMLAGIMGLANKNLLGGTLFTTFAFNWVMNWWVLSNMAEGRFPDPTVALSVDVCFLVIFVVLGYAFAYHSALLAFFLADICLLYVLRITAAVTHTQSLAVPIALTTVVLTVIALWLAFAVLVNSSAGRPVFRVPGPLLTPTPPAA